MGILSIKMKTEHKDLVLSIQDNGKGFNKKADTTGYGLKLSQERITLLNQLYKE